MPAIIGRYSIEAVNIYLQAFEQSSFEIGSKEPGTPADETNPQRRTPRARGAS